jgi:hypothetical protein
MENSQPKDPTPTGATKPVRENPQPKDSTATGPTKEAKENPQPKGPAPTGPTKPVIEKRTSQVLPFAIGIATGLALAIGWPKLAPLATCLQEVAQNEFPINTGTDGDDVWRKFYLAAMIGAVGVLLGSLVSKRLLMFVLGLIAGLGLVMVWPKLAPLATCFQKVAQTSF